MLKIQLAQNFTDTTLPLLKRDKLLLNDNGGVKFLADLSNTFSWPGGAPVNGSAVKNINEAIGADASMLIQSGDSISYAGGGFDLSALAKVGNELDIPAAVAADIWAAANQYFMVCIYMKLPALADWNSGANLAPFLQWAASSYQVGPEIVTMAFQSASSVISLRRQNGAGTADVLSLVPAAGDYGSVAQIAFWRNASGQGARLKTANGTVSASAAVGVNNTQNFAALPGKLGVPVSGFNGAAGANISAITGHANTFKARIYRAFVENLVASGRTPTTVLDDDWTRTIARGVFS